MKRRRRFTAEFKADAVALVQQQGYTVAQACQALEIGETALSSDEFVSHARFFAPPRVG